MKGNHSKFGSVPQIITQEGAGPFSPAAFIALLFLSLVFFLFLFLQFNVSAADFGKFLLGLLIIVYVPGRRVVLDSAVHSYLPFHLLPREISQRKGDVARFFRDPQLSGDILEKYRVNFVVVRESQNDSSRREPPLPACCYMSLGTTYPKKFQQSHGLGLAFRNATLAIDRVEPIPEQARKVFMLEESGMERRLVDFRPIYEHPR